MLSDIATDIENEIKQNNIEFSSDKVRDLISNFKFINYQRYLNLDETRIKLFKNETLDIYLLIWKGKEKSKIHNHSKNGCWLKVLKGSILENRYDKDFNLSRVSFFRKDNISFMRDDIGYHNIENLGDDTCVSLHFYSPPDHETIYFEK